ncbi:hypothetical protein PACILC2_22460 [Paenibacillus cisolokensis]|uniref:Uncharacterized protein n=1 Tax=Paenibacillus cisolokensis TaxID=1658519 RepID=A0ABQ4N636_9BACL|nr:hypothetical protein [Paenibacillus cisolokensis]GIQ63678.1 hypothetical protein PACILC2_22460 [Paenibacillus cisolokensis]
MAKLENVKVAPDLTTIEYDGDTYYRLADGQEPQDGDLFYVVDDKLIGTKTGDVFAVFTDPDDGELTYINNDDEECFAVKYTPDKCRIFSAKGRPRRNHSRN